MGGSLTTTDVVLNFGATPTKAKRFVITTPATSGGKVFLQPSAVNGDALELDHFACAARITATDTVEAFISAVPGPVTGEYTFTLFFL